MQSGLSVNESMPMLFVHDDLLSSSIVIDAVKALCRLG
jgi:hypothetical protein